MVLSPLARSSALLLAGLAFVQSKPPRPPTLPEIATSSTPWTLAPPHLEAQADVVQTDVTVRDSHGNPIAGLRKSNFVMLEDGKPRPLTYFSVVTAHGANPAPVAEAAGSAETSPPSVSAGDAPPRYIAMLFDDINTDVADLMTARRAAVRMIQAGLGANDHVCVFTASGTQTLDCTNQAVSLERTIGRINPHPESGGATLPCPRISGYEAAQVVLHNNPIVIDAIQAEAAQCVPSYSFDPKIECEPIWDSERDATADILQALQHVTKFLAHQLGQRVLLLASSGFTDDTMGDAVQAIIQDARRNDVVINSLGARGLFTQDAGRPEGATGVLSGPLNAKTFQFEEQVRLAEEQDSEDAMASLAAGTGGLFFHNNNDLTLGFRQLASAPPIVYQLGFALDVPHDGKYHTLKVVLAPHSKYVTVQARPGYFAPSPGITVGDFFAAMDDAMRANDSRSAVPAALSVAQSHLEVDLSAKFDVAKLPFLEHLGRMDQKLIVTAALFDSRGELAEGKRGELDLWLLPATRRRFAAEGLQTRLSLYTARPGNYRLRVVVGESTDARLSTFDQELQVH